MVFFQRFQSEGLKNSSSQVKDQDFGIRRITQSEQGFVVDQQGIAGGKRDAIHFQGSAHQVPVAAPVEVADQIRAFMDRSTPSLVVSESSD